MNPLSDFEAYRHKENEQATLVKKRVQDYLLLKMEKARSLKRGELLVNAKNLHAEMNLNADVKLVAAAMLELRKPTDEILYGKATSPGATLTIRYLVMTK